MFFFGPHSFTPLIDLGETNLPGTDRNMRWQKPGYHCSIHVGGLWREVVEWNSWSLIIPKGRCRFPISGGFVEAPGGEWMNLEGCGVVGIFFCCCCWNIEEKFGCLVVFWGFGNFWLIFFCVVLDLWCFCLVVLRLERIQEDVYMMKIVDKLKSCFVFLWCVCYMPVGWFSGCRMSFGILRHTSWVMHSKQGTDWSKALGIFCNIKVSIGQGSCLESVCWLSPCPL